MTDFPSSATASSRTSSQESWLEVRDIAKHFGGVHALRGVSLKVRRGFVHGLIGANGAGKSTLVKCLAGVVSPDSGEIFIDNQLVTISDPHQAGDLGLAFIHQEVSLVPGFDVFRNMTLGIPPQTRYGVIDWRSLRHRAEAVHQRLEMRFPLNANIDDLSTADQWLVLIGRALMRDAVLIAMDEPTASLSAAEVERVHTVVRDLVANNVAVIFVSHRLDEVVELCDDITVFRDGNVVSRASRGEVTKSDLVRAIVGHEVSETAIREPQIHGRVVLDVKEVSDKKLLRNVSLSIHEGEVLGLAGLVGAGRTELAKIIYGETAPTSGEVFLNGKKTHFREPADAAAAGIGFVPEERRSEAIFADRSIAFNIAISSLAASVISRWIPLLKLNQLRTRALGFAKDVTVNTEDMRQLIGSLSGGNQQKAVIARWLARSTNLLILDEPSRGVDVGARTEIHRVIRELAEKGTAILAISSDVEELVGLCDRVIVMVEGHIQAELIGTEITTERMISLSFNRRDEHQ